MSARDRLWPLWGTAAGLAGFTATVALDTRTTSELEAVVRRMSPGSRTSGLRRKPWLT